MTIAAALLLTVTLPALSAAGLTVSDQTGRSLTLPAPPRRIVSLVPSVTEILFAIGAQDVLVGVTDFCDYPPEARKKPSVGGMVAPSLETIVALKPDLVVATSAGNGEAVFTQLDRLKIAVYVVNPTRLSDVFDLIARLGALTGREAEATRLSARLSARVRAVAERVAALPRPRVLYVLWPDPLIVPARGALVSELLVLAGAASVTAEGGDGYPRYSLEAAVAGAPEVIILASHSHGQGPMVREKWERFTRAARGEVRARLHGVRRPPPSLRPARGRRPRAARPPHPSRAPVTRLLAALAALGLATAALAVAGLFVGSAPVSARAVVAVLTRQGTATPVDEVVVLSLRLPRIAAALLAGGALAVAGVGFQGLTRNPLAEPSVLGVSSGAAFGVVLAQVFGLRTGLLEALGLTAFAFAGAFVAGSAVYVIAASAGGLPVHTLVLAGVIVGIFFSSAITVLISIVDFDRLGGVIHWLLGNLAPLPPPALGVFGLVAALGFWLVLGQSRPLNLLALGEEGALQLGVDAERVKRRVFVGAALLTASAVAFVGPIGFVGLIVPHALRMTLGPDNRTLVPTAFLGGGLFLLAADTLARTLIAPAELPVGVITSFCGAPFFVYLLRSRSARIAP